MKSQSHDNFWQRIHKSAKENGFPLRVMFELTYTCNFSCRHCYVPRSYCKKTKGKELKTKEVFSILDQLAALGCFYLGFTGGEPFMREDIIEILRYAKRKGFELIIYTNGSLINETIANQLAEISPNKIDITIPAMSKTAFERITRAPGSHKRVFKAIELLNKRSLALGFKTCVLKENEDEIKSIQDFAVSLGALHRLDDRLSARLDGSDEPFKYRGRNRFSILGSRFSEKSECRALESEHRAPSTENLFKCGVGVSQAAITPLGELKMCVMIDYPKYEILYAARRTPQVARSRLQSPDENASFLREACSVKREAYSLNDAWRKLKELVKGIRPDENYRCNRCELEPDCKWCPAKGWLNSRSFTACDLESRSWAVLCAPRLRLHASSAHNALRGDLT